MTNSDMDHQNRRIQHKNPLKITGVADAQRMMDTCSQLKDLVVVVVMGVVPEGSDQGHCNVIIVGPLVIS